uniref:protein adenylyltransferase n=1 Tax=Caulobacter sp. (strain K31) TaxID=366602 RepID=B0T2Y2_CAUSK
MKNRFGLRHQDDLNAFEAVSVALRAEEPLPAGRFSPTHYRAIHRHLFQDVYSWAGRYRTVRMAKDRSPFCYPDYIAPEMDALLAKLRAADALRGLEATAFAEQAAMFLTALNAIHPFREGNGRTQLTFMTLLAARAGHPFDLARLEPEAFLKAMISSFFGDEAPLRDHIRRLVAA